MYTETLHDKIDKKVVTDLESNSLNFEYVKYTLNGVTALHNNGLLPKRKALLIKKQEKTIGYAIFTNMTHLKAQKIMVNDYNETEAILAPIHKKVIFVDFVDVAKNERHLGVGSALVKELKSLNQPILLQVTPDSEGFWWKHGFRSIDDSRWYLYEGSK